MLWKVEFIQTRLGEADYGQVAHVIQDTASNRRILSMSFSPEKLVSISSYVREPQRASFGVWIDAWITDKILSGEHEYERGLNHYGVKIYLDGVIKFSGYLDVSQLSYSPAMAEISLMAYDGLKLFGMCEDLEKVYTLSAGYNPTWLMSYYATAIRNDMGLALPVSVSFARPDISIPGGSPISLVEIGYADMLAVPIGTQYSYSQHTASWAGPQWGYRFNLAVGEIVFVFAHAVIMMASFSSIPQYAQGRIRGRIIKITNAICTEVTEHEHWSDWVGYSNVDTQVEAIQGLYDFLMKEVGLGSGDFSNLVGGAVVNPGGNVYGSSHWNGNSVTATFSGQVLPAKLQLKNDSAGDAEFGLKLSHLRVIQAMMLMWNCSLVAAGMGVMMRSKEADSVTPVAISQNSVVGTPALRKVAAETPDLSALDVLAGDTTLLKDYVKAYLVEWHARWEINLVVDEMAAYELFLGGRFSFMGREYMIMELTRDYEKDEYAVRGWEA